jgi:polyhydroxyalkanoate synthesis regulator phasin
MSDKTAQHVHDLVEDTVTKAGELADQARTLVSDTVADAKTVIGDLDDNTEAAVAAARDLAVEAYENVSAAFKRSPARVIALGSIAFAVAATVATLIAKRR